jgi:hypothetical protein
MLIKETFMNKMQAYSELNPKFDIAAVYRQALPGEVYEPFLKQENRSKDLSAYVFIISIVLALILTTGSIYVGAITGIPMTTDTATIVCLLIINKFYPRSNIVGEMSQAQNIGAATGFSVPSILFIFAASLILAQTIPSISMKVMTLNALVGCSLGSLLGVVLMNIFRQYFCIDMHGKLLFPGSIPNFTIMTQSTKQESVILLRGVFSSLFVDSLSNIVNVIPSSFSIAKTSIGTIMKSHFGLSFGLSTQMSVVSVGMLMGLRSNLILVSAGIFMHFFFIPLCFFLFHLDPAHTSYFLGLNLANLATSDIYSHFGKYFTVGVFIYAAISTLSGIVWKSRHQIMHAIASKKTTMGNANTVSLYNIGVSNKILWAKFFIFVYYGWLFLCICCPIIFMLWYWLSLLWCVVRCFF